MPKAYVIVAYRRISDPQALAAYAALSGPALTAGGGRFIVRGMPERTLEAGLKERVVVIEFDSVEQASAAFASAAYARALAELGDSVERDIRIVAGT